jgi:hypothetical protein
MKKLAFMVFLTSLIVLALGTTALANPTTGYDITTAVGTTLGELTSQFWALIAVIVPVVLTIVGGRLVITKGIGWFKSLTGKA